MLFRRGLSNRILSDSTKDVIERGVFGQPVLIPWPIGDQVAKDVVAHPAGPLRGPDACLIPSVRRGIFTVLVPGKGNESTERFLRSIPLNRGPRLVIMLGTDVSRGSRPQSGGC